MSLDLFQKRIRLLQEDLAQVIAEGLNAGHSAEELFRAPDPEPVRKRVRTNQQVFDL